MDHQTSQIQQVIGVADPSALVMPSAQLNNFQSCLPGIFPNVMTNSHPQTFATSSLMLPTSMMQSQTFLPKPCYNKNQVFHGGIAGSKLPQTFQTQPMSIISSQPSQAVAIDSRTPQAVTDLSCQPKPLRKILSKPSSSQEILTCVPVIIANSVQSLSQPNQLCDKTTKSVFQSQHVTASNKVCLKSNNRPKNSLFASSSIATNQTLSAYNEPEPSASILAQTSISFNSQPNIVICSHPEWIQPSQNSYHKDLPDVSIRTYPQLANSPQQLTTQNQTRIKKISEDVGTPNIRRFYVPIAAHPTVDKPRLLLPRLTANMSQAEIDAFLKRMNHPCPTDDKPRHLLPRLTANMSEAEIDAFLKRMNHPKKQPSIHKYDPMKVVPKVTFGISSQSKATLRAHIGGYRFSIRGISQTTSNWTCCIHSCPATLILSNDCEYRSRIHRHNHEPEHAKIEKSNFIIDFRKLLKKNMGCSCISIYNQIVKKFKGLGKKDFIPPWKSVSTILTRVRNAYQLESEKELEAKNDAPLNEECSTDEEQGPSRQNQDSDMESLSSDDDPIEVDDPLEAEDPLEAGDSIEDEHTIKTEDEDVLPTPADLNFLNSTSAPFGIFSSRVCLDDENLSATPRILAMKQEPECLLEERDAPDPASSCSNMSNIATSACSPINEVLQASSNLKNSITPSISIKSESPDSPSDTINVVSPNDNSMAPTPNDIMSSEITNSNIILNTNNVVCQNMAPNSNNIVLQNTNNMNMTLSSNNVMSLNANNLGLPLNLNNTVVPFNVGNMGTLLNANNMNTPFNFNNTGMFLNLNNSNLPVNSSNMPMNPNIVYMVANPNNLSSPLNQNTNFNSANSGNAFLNANNGSNMTQNFSSANCSQSSNNMYIPLSSNSSNFPLNSSNANMPLNSNSSNLPLNSSTANLSQCSNNTNTPLSSNNVNSSANTNYSNCLPSIPEPALKQSTAIDEVSSSDQILTKPPADHVEKDEHDVFAEYIASKLRQMNSQSASRLQKAIGHLIFEAEIKNLNS